MLRSLLLVSLVQSLLLVAAPAAARPTTSTFTLDGFSFISFGSSEVVYLPAGSTIKFRFATPAADGSVRFTIEPEDVEIPAIPLADGKRTLQYAIARTASGTMHPAAEGRKIEFDAVVRATLSTRDGQGSYEYAMPFTTEEGVAKSLDGRESVSRTGVRIADGVWYGQMVGTATNKSDAYPGPGAAVYTVLSGRFDAVP